MNLSFLPARALRSLALGTILSLAAGVSVALPVDKHPFGLDDYSPHDLCILIEGLSLEDGDNGAVTNRRY